MPHVTPDKKRIAYRKGYKYQLADDYFEHIPVRPKQTVKTDYISLSVDGRLMIKKGYAWDGASDPAIDTKNFMRGSLVHDALYQLMRANLIDRSKFKKVADRLLQRHCKQDGMSSIRAWWVYQGLKIGGKAATLAKNVKKILYAPK